MLADYAASAAAELGLEMSVDVSAILDLAKDAAHGVERPAAPLTTYLLGVAVGQGADPAQAAATLRRLIDTWPPAQA